MDEGRELPIFDNHYSNQTLVDTWWESRWCHDPTTGARLPLSLSGASAAQYHQDQLRWGPRQNTTYTDDYSRVGWAYPIPGTVMTRPHGLGKELLLSTGENMYIRGPPTSWDYGAQYRSSTLDVDCHSEEEREDNPRIGDALLAATASANAEDPFRHRYGTKGGKGGHSSEAAGGQEKKGDCRPPPTLYDCLHDSTGDGENSCNVRLIGGKIKSSSGTSNGVVEEIPVGSKGFFPRALSDTSGRNRQLNPIAAEALPDYRLWSRYFTTRQAGDLPVEHFSFQKKLPPSTR